MSELIVLDPSAVAEGRTQFDLTPWVAEEGPDWGDAAIEAYMAQLAIGSVPIGRRRPNRTITIPLRLRDKDGVVFADVRDQLMDKVGTFHQRRGWISRPSSRGTVYAEIVDATLHLSDSTLATRRNIDVDAVLTLQALPDFFGDEEELTLHTGSGALVFTERAIKGNYPGRVRIQVDEDSGHTQKGLLWAFRCEHYDSAATAAPYYASTDLTELLSGATTSGATLGAGSWVGLLSTTTAGGDLTHTGTYRVWARARAVSGVPYLRLLYDVGDFSRPEENDAVAFPATGADYLLDLGTINIEAAPLGTHRWKGIVQAFGEVSTDQVIVKELLFQNLDETAGRLAAVQDPTAPSLAMVPTAYGIDRTVGSVDWIPSGSGAFAEYRVPLTSGQISHYLTLDHFGFAVPSGATILGVQATIVRKRAGAGSILDERMRLIKGGTIQSGDLSSSSPWALATSTAIYGDDSSLWGATLTPSDVNATSFGIAIATTAVGVASAYIFEVTLTVYYQLGTGFSVADAVVFASKTLEIRTDGVYRESADGVGYGKVTTVIGDLPRIPTSGSEHRTIECMVRPTRGDLDALPDVSNADALGVKLYYRPSYIARL